jgi:Uncharacterised protein family (UPF0164)
VHKFRILVVSLLIISISAGMANCQNDISGFSTLLVSPAARHAGMGDGIGASGTDLFTLYSNPAGILNIPYFTVGAAHNEWIADYRSEYLGLAYHPSNYAIGFSVNYGTVDNIERRTGPSEEPIGYFDLNDLVAGLTVARSISDNIKLGMTAKLVYEKIDTYSATGFAVDFGFQYLVLPEFTFGASFSNLGSKLKLDEEEYDLPKIIRAGVSYRIQNFLISGNMVYPTDDDPHFHLGGEYNLSQMFYLRSGFQSGYDEKAISFGLGFEEKGFNIDYAYVPFKSDLGDTHRVSFTYSLLKEE